MKNEALCEYFDVNKLISTLDAIVNVTGYNDFEYNFVLPITHAIFCVNNENII